MQIDKKKIKNNLKNEAYINNASLDDKLIDEYVDEICDLSIDVVTALSDVETMYLRKRLGVYDNGEIQSYRIVSEPYGTLAQNVCVSMHKIYNIIIKKIKSGSVKSLDNKTKMSSLMLSNILHDTDISKLNINSRIRRVLNDQIKTVYDLLSYSFIELEKMGLGLDSINNLANIVHGYGLKFIDELTDEERKIVVSMSSIEMIDNSSLTWIKNIERLVIRNVSPNGNIGKLKKYYQTTGELSNETLNYAKSIGIDLGIHKMAAEDMISCNMSIEEILNISIDNLLISARLYNALNRYGIKTFGDVIKYTKNDLKNIKGINEVGINELINFVHSAGLCFRDEKTKMSIYSGRICKGLEPFVSSDIKRKRELIEEYRFLNKIKDNMEHASERIHKEVMEQMKEENSIQKTLS